MRARRKARTVRAGRTAEVVAWMDHAEPINKRTWDVPTNPAHLYPAVVFSLGFVLSESDNVLELSRDLSEHDSVGGCLHILKRCIIYRLKVRVPAAKVKP